MAFCSLQGPEKYRDHFETGIYVCASCANPLFSAKSKYAHSTPWPAFTEPVSEESITKEVETEPQESCDKPAMKLFCGKCKLKIGHEFVGDGPSGCSRF